MGRKLIQNARYTREYHPRIKIFAASPSKPIQTDHASTAPNTAKSTPYTAETSCSRPDQRQNRTPHHRNAVVCYFLAETKSLGPQSTSVLCRRNSSMQCLGVWRAIVCTGSISCRVFTLFLLCSLTDLKMVGHRFLDWLRHRQRSMNTQQYLSAIVRYICRTTDSAPIAVTYGPSSKSHSNPTSRLLE